MSRRQSDHALLVRRTLLITEELTGFFAASLRLTYKESASLCFGQQ